VKLTVLLEEKDIVVAGLGSLCRCLGTGDTVGRRGRFRSLLLRQTVLPMEEDRVESNAKSLYPFSGRAARFGGVIAFDKA